jgi:alkylated DNA nucleotide flippase Atl1
MTNPEQLQRETLRVQVGYHQSLARVHRQMAHDLAALAEGDEGDVEAPPVKGAVQRRIVQLPQLFTERGMTAGEIAIILDHDEANTYTSLNSLEKSGLLEVVQGISPRRWRFDQKHRTDRVLRLSRLVPAGRWTTYGDFAIAVYDNARMSRAVARAAAKNPAFANPHRVLLSGGRISPEWMDAEGRGPERCRELLEVDGVRFADDGAAKPAAFVGWEELKELLDADERQDDAGDQIA